MLNALQTLSLSVHDEDTQEVKVGRMRRRVILMETVESRQDLLHEFAQRSKEFVKTSVEWAPDTVQSHLQVGMSGYPDRWIPWILEYHGYLDSWIHG